jgi:hypothetical protein
MSEIELLKINKITEFEGEQYAVLRYTGLKDNKGNPLYEAINARAEFPKPVVIIPIPPTKENIPIPLPKEG